MPSLLTTHHHHFDLHSADSLPDSYAWTPLDDHRSDGQSHLPIIDLDSPDAVHSIGLACLHWGAFHVINHRIPPDLLHRVLSETTRLFSLPTHRKLLAARSPDGVSGFGPARISRFFDKRFWSEGFTIVGGPPMDHARRLWPDRADHTSFCETMGEYEKAMEDLTGRLMGLALASLGLDKRDACEFQGGLAVMQLNSYPACPDPGRAMGLAAHTDSTLLTVLHQTTDSVGLQVLHRDGRWVGVLPVPGALVVHVGDLLHVISNGRWESVVHRAVVDRDLHRYSVAYLCGPPSHVRVSPASALVGPGREAAAYRPVMWGEYLGLKARLFDGALASISVHNMQNKIKTKNNNRLE
ncbi:Gibberellin 3-beta-dioxygenase 1 [Acorus gramineus]|uniref:Gibberellin 3-beta-dioxygenase 1 n=1 Tax=Acorus gramineus TaxID=55184 RepID=A0AAV9A774_ACOGR|nr:Gibberellin 3-beta-dioxygenase 1 [Acorus gramineus]